jgi:hypothetical protein
MRGLWDNEQPLSPALLRSALALVGVFLGLTCGVILIISVANFSAGKYAAAGLQLAAGIAIPFSIWLGLRMLADMLVVLNRSHDRLSALEASVDQIPATEPAPTRAPVHANGPAAERALDDGPSYPAEE